MSFNIHPLPQNQPPPRTGQAFLRRIHGPDWTDIWVASSDGWGGGRAGDIITSFPVSTGHYYSAAHIRLGATTRSNATFESLWAIVIDDVGTSAGSNLDLDGHRMFLPEPTAIIETSENNFQWLYALAAPEPDIAKISAAFAALKLHPLLGPGFKDTADLTHYFRLPGGVNPKPGKESFSTTCRELDLGNRYEFDQLMAAFGINMAAATVAAPLRAPASAPSEQVPVARIRAMFDALPNNFDRWAWLSMAHAVAAATQGEPAEARDAFVAWSATHIPKDPQITPDMVIAEAERVWDTLGDDHKAGAGTLRRHLEQGASRYKDRIVLDPGEGFAEEVDETRAEAAVNDIASIAKLKDEAKETEDLLAELYKARGVINPAYEEPDPNLYDKAHELPLEDISDPQGPFIEDPTVIPEYSLNRGYASMIVGPPSAGKSALGIAIANAVVNNAPRIAGSPATLKPYFLGDAIIIGNEDGVRQSKKRLAALRLHHKLTGAPQHGTIHFGQTQIARKVGDKFVLTCSALLRTLIKLRKKSEISVIVIDTLASVVAGIGENDNSEMQEVMQLLKRIAWATWSAVIVMHHPTKTGMAGDKDRSMMDGRGASSTVGAVRASGGFSPPTPTEREEYGFTPDQMKTVVVYENTKQSWGRAPQKVFFNKISVGVPGIDALGALQADDAVVLEPFNPIPLSNDDKDREVLDAIARHPREVKYDHNGSRSSNHKDHLTKITGLRMPQLREIVTRLRDAGKVGLRDMKVNGNLIPIIEIVEGLGVI